MIILLTYFIYSACSYVTHENIESTDVVSTNAVAQGIGSITNFDYGDTERASNMFRKDCYYDTLGHTEYAETNLLVGSVDDCEYDLPTGCTGVSPACYAYDTGLNYYDSSGSYTFYTNNYPYDCYGQETGTGCQGGIDFYTGDTIYVQCGCDYGQSPPLELIAVYTRQHRNGMDCGLSPVETYDLTYYDVGCSPPSTEYMGVS